MTRFRGNVSKTRIRHDSRTIPIYGDPERGDGLDAGVWFRCWHCGWLNSTRQNALGDSQSRDGIVLKDYAQVRDDGRGQLVLGKGAAVQELNGAGEPIPAGHALMISQSSFGCSLCGTLNWRGDY